MTETGFPFRTMRLASVTWWVVVSAGWALVAFAVVRVASTSSLDLLPAFVMTSALAILLELLPVMQGRRHNPQGVVMSTCFVCALMLIWGPWPAIVIVAVGSLASDVRAGKDWWKVVFNPAQYAVTAFAASLVIRASLGAATLEHPWTTFQAHYLIWMACAWAVWMLVNFALVAAVLTGEAGFVENFVADFRHEARLTMGVLALSPLVLVLSAQHWELLPLLLIPMLILYQTGQMAMQNEHAAGHDSLTGLPNRTTLAFDLERALIEHERSGMPFALMLIDLDDFKRVNDTFGHQFGDSLLVSFADRLRNAVRPGDCIARLGGDEFAVLVFDVEEERALAVAERVREAVSATIVVDSIAVEIRMSLGIALCPDHGADGTGLLRRADVAMYSAKAQRRAVAVYSPERDDNSADQIELVVQLRQALRDGDIELQYQPKVATEDSTPIGFEALARWRHPTRGVIPPDDFIGLAERSGVMPELTARVLDLAMAQSVRWREMGVDLPIAVNVSPTDLSGTSLVTLVDSLLERHGVDPGRLTLEITEQMATGEVDEARHTLQQLRSRGVRVSLDDFGMGYSSLIRLTSLDVDEIKIDRVFVTAMLEGDAATSIVRTIVDLAHARGLPAVAEGVETVEQLRLLAGLGCDGVQGWHVSPPLPADGATDWIQARLAYGPLSPLVVPDPKDLLDLTVRPDPTASIV